MSWQIRIAYQDRDDDLIQVASAARNLDDPEDALVTATIAMNAFGEGLENAGQLVDRLDAMTQAERRELLDRARLESGLERVRDVEGHRAFEAAQRTLRPRPPQRCAVCGAVPTNAAGFPDLSVARVKRWHCPAHVHKAEPGDMAPPPSLVDAKTMRVIDPGEVERDKRRERLAAAEIEERRRERDRLAAEQAAAQREREERVARELPPGFAR